MTEINKSFFGVQVLRDVSFDLNQNEVHVLLGQNGAGKSTLIKILSGAYTADSGSVKLNGEPIDLLHNNPTISEKNGIITIYQNFHLIPDLTVEENLSIYHVVNTRKLLNWKQIKRRAIDILEDIKFDIDPQKKVKELPVSQKQMLEIAIALSKNAKILIMDEPTAALSNKEVATLFEIIRSLKSRGIGIIYISHKLEEIRQIGDRVTILRDGENVITLDPENVDVSRIIEYMVGNKKPKSRTFKGENRNDYILQVENIINSNLSKPISFSIKKNEVLGITGLVGAGKTELARAVFGADKIDGGRVILDRSVIDIKDPRDAVSQGIGYLPEDRDSDGLCLNMDVKENLSMVLLMRQNNAFIHKDFDRDIAEQAIGSMNIKTTGSDQKVKYLSGGNKQKVIFGKWLNADCHVLLLDEPTIGIDVGARGEIYELIHNFAESPDRGVVIFSSDMEEILEVSDRILVMSNGSVVKELFPDTATKQLLMKYSVQSREA
jgi:ribose transport system ATP-binding protein